MKIFKKSKKNHYISEIIIKGLSIIIFVAFLISSLVNAFILIKQSKDYSDKLLRQAIDDIIQKVDYDMQENFILLCEDIQSYITAANDTNPEDVKKTYNKYKVSEVNIIDENGIIIESTEKKYIGYDMKSSGQSADFFENVKQYGKYVQNCQATSYDASVQMAYSGVRLKNGSYLQVGFSDDILREYIASFLSTATKFSHVGLEGDVIVVDSSGNIISSNNKENLGKSLYEISGDTEQTKKLLGRLKSDGNIKIKNIMFDNVSYKCAASVFFDNYMIAVSPIKEVYQNPLFSIFISSVITFIVFVVLLIRVYILIKKCVVSKIKNVNSSLAEIADGNLNVDVNIRSSIEFSELSDSINNMGDSLKKYNEKEREQIQKELKLAETVQLSAIPTIFPPFPDRTEFDLHAVMQPAKTVGGDFYDFFFIDDDILAFMIADVSGKGIPAAMFMMKAKTIIKNQAKMGVPLKTVMQKANDSLYQENSSGMFVTVWIGFLNVRTGHLTYINAGHNKPLIYRQNEGYFFIKDKSGIAVALMDDFNYKVFETNLKAGDKIFLYTDGVTEANNADEELYTEAELLNFLNKTGDCPAKELCEKVKDEVVRFSDGAEQFDDITMLALTYIGSDKKKNELTVDAEIYKIETVISFLEENLAELYCPYKILMKLEIVAEEIFVNIANYAYTEKGKGIATIIFESDVPGEVKLTFIDYGVPYNPLNKENPDITLPEDQRPIGGLGIFMVKKNVDDIRYEYDKGRNILTIIKKWTIEQ